VPALFQPYPILQVQRLCLHLSTLKHRREWLAGAAVATVSASVNADCDNGTALQRQAYAGLNNSRKKVLLRASLISTCQSPAASPLPLTGSYTYSTEVP